MYKKLSILAIFLTLTLVLTACSSKTPVKRELSLKGTLEVPVTAITAPREGKILGLILDKGDRIRKDQPLFAIARDTNNSAVEQATAELARAEANLRNAKSGGTPSQLASAQYAVQSASSSLEQAQNNYNKLNKLYSVGGIAKNKLDQAQASVEQAQESYEASQTYLTSLSVKPSAEDVAGLEATVTKLKEAYNQALKSQEGDEVKAPSTCTVVDIMVKNGDTASVKQNIMTVKSLTDCTIKANLSGPSTAALTEGKTVSINAPSLKHPFEGKIAQVKDNVLTVTSSAKPEDLADGSEVTLTITIE
jgi:HlyD family secretion protein